MKIKFLIVMSGCAFLYGCGSVIPQIQYKEITSPADMSGMTDSFYLQANSIYVEKIKDGTSPASGDKGVPFSEFSITSKRVPSSFKYGIKAVSSWRQDTKVNLTKIDNSDLISSIGVETTDKTVKSITDYGGAIVKLLGAVGGMFSITEPKTCIFPVSLDILPSDINGQGNFRIEKDCVTVDVEPISSDAASRADAIKSDLITSNYFYAACREAVVTVNIGGTTGVKAQRVRIADPRFVQYVQLPSKGAVTMHSECGTSVLTEQVAVDNDGAIVGALATQAKAIIDAIDAAKK